MPDIFDLIDAEETSPVAPAEAHSGGDIFDMASAEPAEAAGQTTFWQRVKNARQSGQLDTELGLLRSQQIYGNETPEIEARIAEIKGQRGTLEDSQGKDRGLIERAVSGAARMTPIMESGLIKGAKRGIATGAGAGLAAAVAGQLGPQVASPEELVTVPISAGVAFGVGMTHGTMQNIGEIEAGLAYDEMADLVDEAGNKIDPTTAKSFAAAVGVINAALEGAQINTLIRSFPGGRAALNKLIRTAASKTIKEVATKKGAKAAAKAVAKGTVAYGKDIATETGQELLQETTSIVGSELAKMVNNELQGTGMKAATAAEIAGRLKETAVESALSFAALSTPGHTLKTESAVRQTMGGGETEAGPTVPPETQPITDESRLLPAPAIEVTPEGTAVAPEQKSDIINQGLNVPGLTDDQVATSQQNINAPSMPIPNPARVSNLGVIAERGLAVLPQAQPVHASLVEESDPNNVIYAECGPITDPARMLVNPHGLPAPATQVSPNGAAMMLEQKSGMINQTLAGMPDSEIAKSQERLNAPERFDALTAKRDKVAGNILKKDGTPRSGVTPKALAHLFTLNEQVADFATPGQTKPLDAQMEALRDGRRPAVLITEGETLPEVPKGFQTAKFPEGTLIFSKEGTLAVAKAGKLRSALEPAAEANATPEPPAVKAPVKQESAEKPVASDTKAEKLPEPVKPTPQAAAPISEAQQQFIAGKVQELGSVEAVQQKYGSDSWEDQFARQTAQELFGNTEMLADQVVDPNKMVTEEIDPFAEPTAEENERLAAEADATDIERNAKNAETLVVDGHKKNATVSANSVVHRWYIEAGYPVKEVVAALRKQSQGKTLTDKQQQIVEAWQENNRRVENSVTGNAYEEDTYEPEWDELRRKISDAFETARVVDENRAMAIMEKDGTDAEVIRDLLAITEEAHGQSSAGRIETEAEGQTDRVRTEEETTGIPAQKVGDDGKLFATPPTFGKKSKPEGANVLTLAMEDEQATAADDAKQTGMFEESVAEVPTPKDYGAGNKLVSTDRAAELRKKLKEKLNNLNSGIDPETLMLGAELAVYHIEAGARQFAQFAKVMTQDLGQQATPYLKMWYMGAKNWPGMDKTGMDSEAAVDAAEVGEAQKDSALDAEGKEAGRDGKIEDFGEVLEGARKHYAEAYRDKMTEAQEVDVADVPLSKSWPEPDYDKLLEGNTSPLTVAFVRAARDEVPSKPRQGWKLKQWSQQVESLRNFANALLSGQVNVEQLQDDEYRKLRKPLSDRADLYQSVGHSKSLKGIRLSAGSYSVYEGQVYSPPKTIWTVETPAKKSMWSNWPRTLAKGDSREEVIAEFKAKFDSLEIGQKSKGQTKFVIYSKMRESGWFVGKKIGRDYVDLERFDDVKAARQYLADNQDKLEAKLAKFKDVPNERKESNSPRVGEDHRNGADVTPEMFAEAFGFRGVQFGNYVEGSKRQQDLNEAYDALLDLAGVLDVPAKSLSLNSELGLAFGARGTGGKNAAKAHYEAGKVVINLTKREGAGSLAHEWFHAVDNYFSRLRKDKSGFLTETARESGEGVRPEMLQAFAEIMKSINRTDLKMRSQKIDRTRTKDYWSTGLEMAARSFESYIIAKLQDQSASNDYLANIVSEAYWEAAAKLGLEIESSYPYLQAAEMPEIRAAFDNFFNVVETKKTDQGVALFSRNQGAGIPLAGLQTALKPVLAKLPGAAGKIHLHQAETELPTDLHQIIERDGMSGMFDGVFWHGNVHLVADNLDSLEDAQRALIHEARHFGLGAMLGNQKKPILAQAAMLFAKEVSQYLDRHGIAKTQPNRIMAAEEVLVDMVKQGRVHKFIDKVVAAVQQWVRSMFPELNLSKAELRNLIAGVDRYLETGDEAAMPIGGLAPAFQRDVNYFRHGQPVEPQQTRTARVKELTNQRRDYLIRKFQDKFIPLLRTQQKLKTHGWQEAEANNAYLTEELYHGIAKDRLDKFEAEQVKPLMAAIKEAPVSLEDLEQYVYAKHAPERNAYAQKINPDNFKEGGSGMTDLEAAAILDDFRKAGKLRALNDLAQKVWALAKMQREIIREGGLEEQERLDAWESFKFYVPLKGAPDGIDEGHGRSVGRGFAVTKSGTKSALGRHSKAENILAHLAAQVSDTIIRAERAKVGKAFLQMVEENPDPELWTVRTKENLPTREVLAKNPAYTALKGKLKRRQAALETAMDGAEIERLQQEMAEIREEMATTPERQVAEIDDFQWMQADNVLPVTREGKDYYVQIEDEDLAKAMKNLSQAEMGKVLRSMAKVARFLSMVYTTLRPEFVITNFERDIQTAMINLAGEQSAKMAAKVAKGVPGALRGIRNALRGKNDLDMAKWYARFKAAGGQVGYLDLQSVEVTQKKIQKLVRKQDGKAATALRFTRQLTTFIGDYNTIVENAVRLSAFKEAVKAGLSEAKAASLAKNLTVNFNRKGELGPNMNALYLFFNAGVQGSTRIFTALKHKRVRRICYGITAMAFALAERNRMLAGDDDDDKNRWDKMSDYTKNTNLLIMRENGDAVKVRLPYGYNMFVALGYTISDVAHYLASDGKDGRSPGAATVSLFKAAMNAFNPLGGDDALLQLISPTILDPFVQSETNENFMGSPIMPEQPAFGPPKPDSQLYWNSVRPWSKAIAQQVNEWTGGSDVVPGLVDISPETLDHFWDFTVGGLGRDMGDAIGAVDALATGKELPVRRMPLVRTVYQEKSEFYDRQAFHDNLNQATAHFDKLKQLSESGRRREMWDYRQKHPEATLSKLGAQIRMRLSKLRQAKEKMKNIDKERYKGKIEKIDQEMEKLMLRFNKQFWRVVN